MNLSLRHHLEALQEPRNPYTHPEAHHNARAYLSATLEKSGRKIEHQHFSALLDHRTVKGVNVLASPSNAQAASFLLVAHYDTVDHSPGADDNGSAVAVALELAQRCPDVAFLFPDLEECGLLGSRHFITTKRWQDLSALVLESVGYWTTKPHTQSYPTVLATAFPEQFRRLQEREFRGDFWALLALERDRQLAQSFAASLSAEVISLSVPDALLHDSRATELRDFGRSDHLAFWEAKRSCLMLTDSANFRNPHYHLPSDTADTLDLSEMSRLTEDIANFLNRL